MKRLSLLAVSMAMAASANAGNYSCDTATLTCTDFFNNAAGTVEFSQSGALSLFDPAQGILTGVQLHVSAGISGVMTVEYTKPSSTAPNSVSLTGTYETLVGFNSTLSAIDSLFNDFDDIVLNYTTGSQVVVSGGPPYVSPTLTDSDFIDNSLSGLAALQGLGTFGLSCHSIGGLGVTKIEGATVSQVAVGQCGASITYTYAARTTNVPEPGSLALVGLALAGIGFTARRKA